eukprot:161377-Amphidinium_carterae.1
MLQERIAELAFVPVCERIIEREHAEVARTTALRNVSGPYVSLSLRRDEIKAILENETNVAKFLSQAENVSDVSSLASALHLAKMPFWNQVCRLPAYTQRHYASGLLYCTNLSVQYASTGSTTELRSRAHKTIDGMERNWVTSRDKQTKRLTAEHVAHACMAKHAKTRLQPGMICSMPLATVPLESVPAAMEPKGASQMRQLSVPFQTLEAD